MTIKTLFTFVILCLGLSANAQFGDYAIAPLAPTLENLGKYLQGRTEFNGNEKEFAQFVLNAVASSEGLHDSEGRTVWSRVASFVANQRKNAVTRFALLSRTKNLIDVYEGFRLKNPAALVVEPYQEEVPPEFNTYLKRKVYLTSQRAIRSICNSLLDPADFRALYNYETELRIQIPSH